MVLIASGVASWYHLFAQQYFEVAQLLSPEFIKQVHESLHSSLYFLSLMVGAHLGFSFFFAVQFSRRLAGPIYAVIRHLQAYVDTQVWHPVKLRRGDCFVELANVLNRVMAAKAEAEKDHSEAA